MVGRGLRHRGTAQLAAANLALAAFVVGMITALFLGTLGVLAILLCPIGIGGIIASLC